MNVMIDTCIVLDVLQVREPFYELANEILEKMIEKNFMGFITAKSLTDIHYMYLKHTHDKEETLNRIKQLFSIFIVADTLADDCFQATVSDIADYEDAVMEQTAKRMHLDCIITRNIKHYKNSAVKVFSPEEFLTNFMK